MKVFDDIPRVWKRAYLLLCVWYAINYSVGTILEYQLETPHTYIFWNALSLLEAHCILMAAIFFYCNWLFQYNVYIQVAGDAFGVMRRAVG